MKSASEVLPLIVSNCVDMWEHFPTLKHLASKCESVIEMGVRGGCSAYALLAGLEQSKTQDRWMIYLDINMCRNPKLEELAALNQIKIQFVQADSREVELPECDLLFIDTLHTYGQLSVELALHHNAAKKFIVMHDVADPYGYRNEVDDGSPKEGLKAAIKDFLEEHNEWMIRDWYTNCHGLAILERQQ